MNPFHNAITTGLAAIRNAAGVAVVYRRGVHEVQVVAVPGRSEYEVDDGHSIVKSHSRDYLIAAADLVLNGERVLPKRGDEVVEPCPDGVARTHQVLGPQRGAEFDWSDSARTQLRIRTKLVATESNGGEA